jgi:hypothetical protein
LSWIETRLGRGWRRKVLPATPSLFARRLCHFHASWGRCPVDDWDRTAHRGRAGDCSTAEPALLDLFGRPQLYNGLVVIGLGKECLALFGICLAVSLQGSLAGHGVLDLVRGALGTAWPDRNGLVLVEICVWGQ